MDNEMDIVILWQIKRNLFNLLKKEVQEFGQQSKNLICENRRTLEHMVEILNDLNNVCEWFCESYLSGSK